MTAPSNKAAGRGIGGRGRGLSPEGCDSGDIEIQGLSQKLREFLFGRRLGELTPEFQCSSLQLV
ncbi:hypothetical protein [Paenibacillus spongiae]|uniref:Uncharacterized protein n=1 Tax=Paenibacillus spongiae TaxID=2909671 RepID=A0ABY5SAM0_9BACL|nr:hypothetical protein [Paenibacillus spongiae]UVI30996.1 hypothetical protein L1F29_03785 [Paenibacillus spongiae]